MGEQPTAAVAHDAGAADLVRRLAAVADVVVENFRRLVLPRHGLGDRDLAAPVAAGVLVSQPVRDG